MTLRPTRSRSPREAADDIARLTGVQRHDIALTLGSGWGQAAELIGETVATVPATEVTGFSRPALEGHVGTLRSVVTPRGQHVLIIGARTHYYEGHGPRRVVHSVRTAAAAGARTMVLTNGAGGIKHTWKPGTPVLISDHINLTGATPLEGATFIDLTDLYSLRLRDLARTIDPSLDEGVYCQFTRPAVRDTRRGADGQGDRRAHRRHVDRARGDRGATGGHGGAGLLADHEHGRRHPDHAAEPPRGHGGGPEAGPVISSLLARVIGAM